MQRDKKVILAELPYRPTAHTISRRITALTSVRDRPNGTRKIGWTAICYGNDIPGPYCASKTFALDEYDQAVEWVRELHVCYGKDKKAT